MEGIYRGEEREELSRDGFEEEESTEPIILGANLFGGWFIRG